MRLVLGATLLALCACRSGFELRDDAITGSGNDTGVSDGGADAPDAPDRANRVFITSTLHPATFGGIAAADAICQARADAENLGGTFIALLGDAARPEPRLAGYRGWVDLKGTPIVDEPATWLDGYMFHPLVYDETGTHVGSATAWVGSIYSCASWTDNTNVLDASIVSTLDAFGAYTITSCNNQARFICAETGHIAPQSPPVVAGRLEFVTVGTWAPGGGVASADAVCAGEATAHSLPGTYRALLTTSSQDGFARFSLTGPPWTRLDGIALTPTAADLANPATTWLDTFPHVRSDGTRYPYVGTYIGSPTVNCTNWTSTSSGQSGIVGVPSTAYRSSWLSVIAQSCNVARNLTCLQE